MLAAGDRIPEVTVWPAPRRPEALLDVLGGRPLLLLFYLFDWSAT